MERSFRHFVKLAPRSRDFNLRWKSLYREWSSRQCGHFHSIHKSVRSILQKLGNKNLILNVTYRAVSTGVMGQYILRRRVSFVGSLGTFCMISSFHSWYQRSSMIQYEFLPLWSLGRIQRTSTGSRHWRRPMIHLKKTWLLGEISIDPSLLLLLLEIYFGYRHYSI